MSLQITIPCFLQTVDMYVEIMILHDTSFFQQNPNLYDMSMNPIILQIHLVDIVGDNHRELLEILLVMSAAMLNKAAIKRKEADK